MSVINTNITSMIGQQNLNKSQNSLTTSMERLSSGLRINSAKDDAAGQAIANRMSAQITGLSQAQRNANDGISVAQTAEGGLNQINDNLQRIRELTVQAQNGTNSQNDLKSIQDEVDQRLAEINRISEETDFNGTRVLSEKAETLNIQVGSQDGQTIDVNLRTIDAASLKLDNFRVAGDQQANAETIERTLGADATQRVFADSAGAEFNVDASGNVTNSAGAAMYVDGSNNLTTAAGETTFAFSAADYQFTTAAEVSAGNIASAQVAAVFGTAAAAAFGTTATASSTFTADIDGTTVTLTLNTSGAATSLDNNFFFNGTDAQLTNLDRDAFTTLGFDASAALTTGSGTVTAQVDGVDVELTFGADGALTGVAAPGGEDLFADENGALTTQGYAEASASYLADNEDYSLNSITVDGTTFDADTDGNLSVGGVNQFVSQNDAGDTVLVDEGQQRELSEDPLEQLDIALQNVDNLRSELGAVQNRFESAIENLSTNETNLSAARSRIEDADYATEVANMTRAQILQQAGTSVLAQANQIPQNVLSLLG